MANRLSRDYGAVSYTTQAFYTTPASPLTPSTTGPGHLDTPSTTGAPDTPSTLTALATGTTTIATATTPQPTPLLNLNLNVLGETEGKPFSRNFDELLEGLGLAHPAIAEVNLKGGGVDHELPDIDDMISSPDWVHRSTDMGFTGSSARKIGKRPGALSIIHEELGESPVVTVPTACLADFEFDFDAFDSPGLDAIHTTINDSINSPSAGTTPSTNMKNSTVCIRRDTGVKYLMKRNRTSPRALSHSNASVSSSWMEQTILEMLTTLGTPFVDGVRWSFHSGEHHYIIMDHLTNGNLVDLTNTNGPLASHQAMFYAAELIAGLSHLHANGIVHRSVSPRSVLLTASGHILLSDFANADYLSHATSTPQQRIVDFTKAEKESVAYCAPELLLGWAHDAAVDCWSFGAVVYFLMFGCNPFEDRDGTTTHTGIYERILRHPVSGESMRLVHPLARDLISKCLERNSAIRWTMEQLKGHAYFSAIDWDDVSAMRLEVPALGSSPLVKSPPPSSKAPVFHTPYATPLNLPVRDSQRHLPLGFNLDIYSRQDIAKESMRKDSLQDIAKIVGRRRSLPRFLDPVQEDDSFSLNLSGSAGIADNSHDTIDIGPVPRPQPEDALTRAERLSRFWDEIDREECEVGSRAPSLNSLEFGGAAPGVPYTKAPKLRKHHSAMHTRNRLFNISTSSFHNILRWKPRSSATLRNSPVSAAMQPPIPSRKYDVPLGHDLPMGVHQMGSGIGFTYNVPAAVHSKMSMCSFVPPCHVFSKRFSAPFLRAGHAGMLANSSHDDKKHDVRQHVEFELPSGGVDGSPVGDLQRNASSGRASGPGPWSHSRNAGNGTFIRDMYRSPGWIVAPPAMVPSPMPLVNNRTKASSNAHHSRRASMYVPAEPLSPATLVNAASPAAPPGSGVASDADAGSDEDACHVNIVIPKDLEFRFDIPHHWAQGSTLRLVPQPSGNGGLEHSFDDSADISMCTLATRGAL